MLHNFCDKTITSHVTAAEENLSHFRTGDPGLRRLVYYHFVTSLYGMLRHIYI